MKPVIDILEAKITAAMATAIGYGGWIAKIKRFLQFLLKLLGFSVGDKIDYAAIVRPATDPKFGDYQVNGIMPLAKKLKTNPRKLAEQIVATLVKTSSIEHQVSSIDDICQTPEIAGPGFINLRLKPDFVAKSFLEITKDPDRLGIEKTDNPKTIVVDFSGPNIAKQMHVGHLRSTIIGDCICRLLEFQGHTVIRQNHFGDWGLPMGMVVEALIEKEYKDFLHHNNIQSKIDINTDLANRSGNYPEFQKNFLNRLNIAISSNLEDLEGHYKDISIREKTDKKLAERVRGRTKDLHERDSLALYFWEQSRKITLDACFVIYEQLGIIPFEKEDIRGESFYADMLADVVDELKKKGLAVESEGAVCVFPPGFKDKEGNPLPLIVQKSDGAFLYATTDLAALRYRVQELKADRIIYVTDARQALHFEMVFAVARMAGWDIKQKTEGREQKTEFVHVTFGSVLGEDGKPLKTRSGENVKLKELLDEAVQRATAVVNEKNPDLPAVQKEQIAKAVGIGAVKYADFTNNRTSDYVFSFNKMLAMEGNTAPYMQYAYARVQSIDRKAQERGIDIKTAAINLTEPAELDLAKHLVRYGEAIESAKVDYRPNYLTSYLYDLAQKFSVFYTNCPVLNASEEKRYTRWLLCDLTAKTIKHGLKELLGIEVVEQM